MSTPVSHLPMDAIDAILLRETAWRPAEPLDAMREPRRPWDIARQLGVHGTTVKRRLADLRERGVLHGIHLQPAPALVGQRLSQHHFRYADASAKRRAVQSLSEDPRVWEVYGLVGDEVVAVLATPEQEDLHADAQRLAAETGALSTRFHHMGGWPVDVERVSALDLRILAAHADDAFRTPAEAAAEVGIAPKTVTARMKALARARAFLIAPLIDYARIQGGMTLFLDLSFALGSSDAAHTAMANQFPLSLCRSARGAENGYLVLHAAGATEVEDMLGRAQALPGVRDVRLSILHDVHRQPARWKDALLARAEELARAKGIWSTAWRARPLRVPRT